MADLAGWTVVVTRPEGDHGPLGSRLRESGARVLHVPTIAIVPPDDPGPLDRACARIERYDWVAFTSARAVHAVASRLGSDRPSTRIASVGPSTSRAIREHGWAVDVEGSGAGGAALSVAMAAHLTASDHVLVPASAIARPELASALVAAGCTVDTVVAYETRIGTESVDRDGKEAAPRADAVTFTSPSAVDGWTERFGTDAGASLDSARVVAIGDTTLGRLETFGIRAHRAGEATLDGVVRCLLELRTESIA